MFGGKTKEKCDKKFSLASDVWTCVTVETEHWTLSPQGPFGFRSVLLGEKGKKNENLISLLSTGSGEGSLTYIQIASTVTLVLPWKPSQLLSFCKKCWKGWNEMEMYCIFWLCECSQKQISTEFDTDKPKGHCAWTRVSCSLNPGSSLSPLKPAVSWILSERPPNSWDMLLVITKGMGNCLGLWGFTQLR